MGDDGDPSEGEWLRSNYVPDRWFGPATDVVHLNWCGPLDSMIDNGFNPILFFLWKTAKAKAASISAGLVGGFNSGVSMWANENFDLFERRKDCRVTLEMITLHVSFEETASSGLFGTLVEERVKLVDPFDAEMILKYHQISALGRHED